MNTYDPPAEQPAEPPPSNKGNRRLGLAAAAFAGTVGLIVVGALIPIDSVDWGPQASAAVTFAALGVLIFAKLYLFASVPIWYQAIFFDSKAVPVTFVVSYLVTLFTVGYAVTFGFDGMKGAEGALWGMRVDLVLLAIFWIQIVSAFKSEWIMWSFRISLAAPFVLFGLMACTGGALFEYTAFIGLGRERLWLVWAVVYLAGLIGARQQIVQQPFDVPYF